MINRLIKIAWYSGIMFFMFWALVLVEADMPIRSFLSLFISFWMAWCVWFASTEYKKGER